MHIPYETIAECAGMINTKIVGTNGMKKKKKLNEKC